MTYEMFKFAFASELKRRLNEVYPDATVYFNGDIVFIKQGFVPFCANIKATYEMTQNAEEAAVTLLDVYEENKDLAAGSYDAFKTLLKDGLIDFLPEEYADAEVLFSVSHKNNTDKEYFYLNPTNGSNSPMIYVEDLYLDFVRNLGEKKSEPSENITNIIKKAASVYLDAVMSLGSETIKSLPVYDSSKILPRLVNRNNKRLDNAPITVIQDMAVEYRYTITDHIGQMRSFLVDNNILFRWGVSLEELHKAAMENIQPFIMPLTEMIKGEFGMDDMDDMDCPMLIVTNQQRVNGASTILRKDVLMELHERLGDFYILPSSVHEVLVLPEGLGDPGILRDMVSTINTTEVQEEERLTDNVYVYRGVEIQAA